ncbi:AfsR/SARP family transcriptional regulator [Angustibacter aerolatus]
MTTDDASVEPRVLLLGPVEVELGDRRVPGGPPLQQAVLACLALSPGRVWSADQLVDAVWGDEPPERPAASLHTYVWSLRRVLGAERLTRSAAGYALELSADGCDAVVARAAGPAAARAVAEGDPERAVRLLAEALASWRGPALAGAGGAGAEAQRHELDQLRTSLAEQLAGLLLRLGRPWEAADALRPLVRENPLREETGELYVAALAANGRRGEALSELRRIEEALRSDLGVRPGPGLGRLARQLSEPAAHVTAARAVPRQLPAPPHGFGGRTAEVRRVAEALRGRPAGSAAAGRLVTVCGAGGLGKSALALHVAHRLTEHFPDGQLHATFHTYDPTSETRTVADVLPGLLAGLGVGRDQQPADQHERSDLYRTLLADRRVLLVLDDVPDAETVRALLPAAPGSAVLVTSRRSLPGLVAREGAVELVLQPLVPAAGVELLQQLLGERPDWSVESAEQLARLCGGWPLGLRLAASLVLRSTASWTLPDAVAQLVDERTRLQLLSVPDDPLADVRAVLDWSVEALSERAALGYCLLGLLPGSAATAPTLAAALEVGTEAASGVLTELAGHHLADPVHDLVHLHAHHLAQQLPLADRHAALDRVLGYHERTLTAAVWRTYGEVASADGPVPAEAPADDPFDDDAAAADWLRAQESTLHDLIGVAAAADRPGAHRLVVALRPHVTYTYGREAWLHAVELGRSSAQRAGNRWAESELVYLLAPIAVARFRYDEAVELERTATQLRYGEAWRAHRGRIGIRLCEARRYDEAVVELTAAIADDRTSDEVRLRSLANLATAQLALDQKTEALQTVEQAVQLLEQVEASLPPFVAGARRFHLAVHLRRLGELARARALHWRNEDEMRRYRSDEDAWTALELAVIAEGLGDPRAADVHLAHAAEQSLDFLEAAEDELEKLPDVDAPVRPHLAELRRRRDARRRA